MSSRIRIVIPQKTAQAFRRWKRLSTCIAAVCLFLPIAALAQSGSPFDTGFTSIQNLFTGNQLNAYFATVPGNYAQNLRKLYLLNTNYADLSFLFTILA